MEILFLLFFVVLLYGFALYYKSKELSSLALYQKVILWGLRIVSVGALVVLFIPTECSISTFSEEKPALLLVTDNSRSISLSPNKSDYSDSLLQDIDRLAERLSSKYRIERVLLGSEVLGQREGELPTFSATATNIGSVLTYADQLFQYNKGTVLLFSDGIYNQGAVPDRIQSNRFTLFTVGLGDTTRYPDAGIVELDYPKTIYKDNDFLLKVSAEASYLGGEKGRIEIRNKDSLVATRAISFESNKDYISETFPLATSESGNNQFRVDLIVEANEINRHNNREVFHVKVTNKVIKVALFYDAPHPDIGAIHSALKQDNMFELDLFSTSSPPVELQPYSVIIMAQLPSLETNMSQLNAILSYKKPLIYLLGEHVNREKFNALGEGISLSAEMLFEVARPVVKREEQILSLSPEAALAVESSPPLRVPLGMSSSKQHIPLLTQKISGLETDIPLVSVIQSKVQKKAFILGEGLWNWRMQQFKQYETHQFFYEFILKLVKYVALDYKTDKLTVFTEESYQVNQLVLVSAEVVNDNYELITSSPVSIMLMREDGTSFRHEMEVRGKGYIANLGRLNKGVYRYTASTTVGGKLFEQFGTLRVVEDNLENKNLVANHDLLRKLAQKHNGRFFTPPAWDSLSVVLMNNERAVPMLSTYKKTSALIDVWWWVLVIVVPLFCEWVLRKRWLTI